MLNDLHSTYALLHDPLSYNYLKDGPPYLPGIVGGKVAAHGGEVGGWVRQAALQVGTDVEVAFQHCVADFGGTPMAELAVLLASLRAEAMIHQAHHWQTRGQTYYGDHLLFERIYGEVNGLIDGLAERAVGKGDTILVQPLLQMSHMMTFTKLFYSDAPVQPTPQEMPLLSWRALMKSAVLMQLAYAALEDKGLLSHGIDNLLQGIADKQESLAYLLKQRSSMKEASMMGHPTHATRQKEATMHPLDAFKHELLTRQVTARFESDLSKQASGPKLDQDDVLDIIEVIRDRKKGLVDFIKADFDMNVEARKGIDNACRAVKKMNEGKDPEYVKALIAETVKRGREYVISTFKKEIEKYKSKDAKYAEQLREEWVLFLEEVGSNYKPKLY